MKVVRRPNKAAIFWLTAVLAGGGLVAGCSQEDKKLSNQEIFMYQAEDRSQKLIAGAKKEAQVSVYTTMQTRDSQQVADAFEKKYPGIKVNLWRASPEKIVQRATIEAKAGRYDVDVLELNGPEMEMIYREKLLAEFYSPETKNIPQEAVAKHRHYVADRFNFFVMAYNTKQVTPEEAPNSYEDLLNPKWRGKLAMEPSDVDWFASVVKAMGEEKGLEFYKKLATQQPKMLEGHTLLAERTASGEVTIALNVYNHGVERLKKKEATIEWKPLQPAFGRAGTVALPINAPHPYAAVLFVDFLLSKEGQEILKENNRVPANRLVDSPLAKFQYQTVDPAIVLDEWEKWSKLWSNLFLGGKEVTKGD